MPNLRVMKGQGNRWHRITDVIGTGPQAGLPGDAAFDRGDEVLESAPTSAALPIDGIQCVGRAAT
jgi:hypothetical protein